METMNNVWAMVEHVRVASGAAELAIFTGILYWFFTSSRVADMLELVGERVGGWCGGTRDPSGQSLRQAMRAKKRTADVYARIDAEKAARTTSLYRVKESPVVPAPQPPQRPAAGLACGRCAPLSRDSWQDPKGASDNGAVIKVLDIGRRNFANGGVVSRYLCDLAQCLNLIKYEYKDVCPEVMEDERFLRAIEDETHRELSKMSAAGDGKEKESVRRRIENKARKVLSDISSAMSNNVLRLVAWFCHKAIRRIAGGGCGTRASCIARLRRAKAAGLPLVFVPLHRSHFDYILVTFTLYLTGLRPPLVAAGDNMRIPFFGWFLRGCGAFYIRRRVDGSEYHGDPVYKTALRAYILNSLSAKNNLEFFIEGGRTRTGKPQLPKAGILSVIMDAYLDGTIDDALLVPVTLNYDRLVDGNFVREQLGRPKQMETFWSALRGIWHTLNTNHGGIRVDFNQPISLKELVTSFQKYNYLKAPIDQCLAPLNNNNLAVNLDRQILYNHSHSSLYGADVSTEHKMMVEAIGRHLVYDASQSTALMSTNVVSYVLVNEMRNGGTMNQLAQLVGSRLTALTNEGRDVGCTSEVHVMVKHALDMLGRQLIRREGSGDKQTVKPQLSIPASLEMAYYANTVVAHYATSSIVATALETLIHSNSEQLTIRHSELLELSLQLSAILSQEFILCPPCRRIEEVLNDVIGAFVTSDLLVSEQQQDGIEEQRWCRRFAKTLEDEDYEQDPTFNIKYKVNCSQQAIDERRRLILTIRPLLESYSATCKCLKEGSQKEIVKQTLDYLSEEYMQNRMAFGEAVSTDAIKNCMRILKQWGVINIYSEGRDRKIGFCHPFNDEDKMLEICHNVYKFCAGTPLLKY